MEKNYKTRAEEFTDNGNRAFCEHINSCVLRAIFEFAEFLDNQEKKGFDLGMDCTCFKCNQRICKCPERQPNGSWKSPEPKPIEKLELKYFTDRNYKILDSVEGSLVEIVAKINELAEAINKLMEKIK